MAVPPFAVKKEQRRWDIALIRSSIERDVTSELLLHGTVSMSELMCRYEVKTLQEQIAGALSNLKT